MMQACIHRHLRQKSHSSLRLQKIHRMWGQRGVLWLGPAAVCRKCRVCCYVLRIESLSSCRRVLGLPPRQRVFPQHGQERRKVSVYGYQRLLYLVKGRLLLWFGAVGCGARCSPPCWTIGQGHSGTSAKSRDFWCFRAEFCGVSLDSRTVVVLYCTVVYHTLYLGSTLN